MFNNNFNNLHNTFQQVYQVYSNALQYMVARETYINQMINQMEIQVKLRLQSLDKIVTDYYELYGEIQQEAARYAKYKTAQDRRIARIEEEVKKIRILMEFNTRQDEKIRKLEEEIEKLRISQEENNNQIQAMERTKAENKEKTISFTHTQHVNNDQYVNDFINRKQPAKDKAECAEFIFLTQAQKTNDDNANDLINRKKLTEPKAENGTKSFTRAQKTNNGNVNDFLHAKEQTKPKTKVGTRLLNQYQKNNDINMNSLSNTKEKKIDEIGNSTGSLTQSEKTSSSSEYSDCRVNGNNLVATKGKKWNNHDMNIWLEHKLKVNAKDKAWMLTVFGEYNHVEFNAPEHKQFLWQNRYKWEEEGIWSWFEC